MSTTTTNYGFIKPEFTDPADTTLTNPNWDNLDGKLADLSRDVTVQKGGLVVTDDTTKEDKLKAMENLHDIGVTHMIVGSYVGEWGANSGALGSTRRIEVNDSNGKTVYPKCLLLTEPHRDGEVTRLVTRDYPLKAYADAIVGEWSLITLRDTGFDIDSRHPAGNYETRTFNDENHTYVYIAWY